MLDISKLPFIEANRFQVANREHIDWIVIHTMERSRTAKAALECARDFATTNVARSAHYCIDSGTIIHCVQEKDIAYGAPPNALGMQLEHAGFANLSALQWQDQYASAMLQLSAELAASIALRYRVPIHWLGPQDLRNGKRGLTSHANVSHAFHLSDHQDPGPNFPKDSYLELVVAAISADEADTPSDGLPGGRATPFTRILRLTRPHMTGADIRAVQTALVRHGFAITIDGDFGPQTKRAVAALQRAQGLSPDGVVGPLTRRALGLIE